MYIVIVYNDLERKQIIGLIYFNKMRHIIDYTGNLIRYNDTKVSQNDKKYKTYKNLFKIINVPNHLVIYYFSDFFYMNGYDKYIYLQKRNRVWKEVMKKRRKKRKVAITQDNNI